MKCDFLCYGGKGKKLDLTLPPIFFFFLFKKEVLSSTCATSYVSKEKGGRINENSVT